MAGSVRHALPPLLTETIRFPGQIIILPRANGAFPVLAGGMSAKNGRHLFLKDGKAPPKWIQTESKLYTQADDPAKVYEEKKGLGY